jgi:hypothetical protein
MFPTSGSDVLPSRLLSFFLAWSPTGSSHLRTKAELYTGKGNRGDLKTAVLKMICIRFEQEKCHCFTCGEYSV